jgi:hypothetical protein
LSDYTNGVFLLPDPLFINGTVTLSVNASGFCIHEDDNSRVSLRLRFYRRVGEHEYELIPELNKHANAVCSFSMRHKKRAIGYVEETLTDIIIAVETEYYMGIQFSMQCLNKPCPFMPFAVESSQDYLHLKNNKEREATTVENSTLQFSVSVRDRACDNMSPTQPSQPPPSYAAIIASFSVVSFVLLTALILSLCLHRRSRMKNWENPVGIDHATNRNNLSSKSDEIQVQPFCGQQFY